MSNADLTWLVSRYCIKTIVDVGAHTGEYGAYLQKLFGAEVVHAIEPNPKHVEELHERGFNVHAVALGNSNLVQAEFKVNQYDAASSLRDLTKICLDEYPQVEYLSSILIPVKRLDDLIGHIDRDLLIKLDAQGYERQIIQGALNLFSQADVVLIEMSFEALY